MVRATSSECPIRQITNMACETYPTGGRAQFFFSFLGPVGSPANGRLARCSRSRGMEETLSAHVLTAPGFDQAQSITAALVIYLGWEKEEADQ